MRLQWKIARPGDTRKLELPVDPILMTMRDPETGRLCFARLVSASADGNLREDLHQLIAEFTEEGAKLENLDVVLISIEGGSPWGRTLGTTAQELGLKTREKTLTKDRDPKALVSLADGSVFIAKGLSSPTSSISKPAEVQRKHNRDRPVRTKVLIVEDSKPLQKILERAYSAIPGIEIVGVESSVVGAVDAAKRMNPDFISLDMKLEGGTGLDVLEKIAMRNRPGTRCVLVTDISLSEGNMVFDALELGATSYIQKPRASDLAEFTSDLTELIAGLFESASAPVSTEISTEVPAANPRSRKIDLTRLELIAIGSSTGGTEVVRDILVGIPKDCPPVLIVQHMPSQFTGLYAERLSRQSGKPTTEVRDRTELLRGHAYLAAGGLHMVLEKRGGRFFVAPDDREQVNRFKPSVSVLFESVLKHSDPQRVVSLMLTGMGRDGAKEMLDLKKAGAVTIGQSQETCVVYGMPRAAAELGALSWAAAPEDMIAALGGTSPQLRKIS